MSQLPIHRSVASGNELAQLQSWVSEIEAWPANSHVWGQYAERTGAGDVICRTENPSGCHEGVRSWVDGKLCDLAVSALKVKASAFKDKLNYKQPRGAGFSPHQDLVAYPGVGKVVSILIALDECSTASGCLWLADPTDEPLPTDENGVLPPEEVSSLLWSPAELNAGDAVCIDGLAPHYSETNHSARSRRVLIASFAPASDGYRREDYYKARELAIKGASVRGGASRISTLADFEGEVVRTNAVSLHSCTHD